MRFLSLQIEKVWPWGVKDEIFSGETGSGRGWFGFGLGFWPGSGFGSGIGLGFSGRGVSFWFWTRLTSSEKVFWNSAFFSWFCKSLSEKVLSFDRIFSDSWLNLPSLSEFKIFLNSEFLR